MAAAVPDVTVCWRSRWRRLGNNLERFGRRLPEAGLLPLELQSLTQHLAAVQ
jgi:hypothetical protein